MKIDISTENIRLDNVLKLSGICQTGGEAKIAIQVGLVFLNDAVCTMRSKQVEVGDIVKYKDSTVEVCRK